MDKDSELGHLQESFGGFLNDTDVALANIEQLTLFLLDTATDGAPPDEVQELFTAITDLQETVSNKWKEVEELYE